jgi:hypothetical protein
MFKYLVLACLMVSFFLNSFAQEDSAAKAQQIIGIEQTLMNALPGDTVPWNKYLAPNWYITTEDGTGYFREAFLRTFSAFPSGFSGNIQVTKPVLVFHDNTAVIHYVADEHESVFGQQLHTTYGMVDTWYKNDSSWVMLSALTFEIPQLPPAIRVKASVLRQYTGTYQMSADRLAVVSLQRDTLFIQKGKNPPEALLAETENVFFRMSDTRGRKIFVRDASGDMIMRERRNGQDLVWKRIKGQQ